ncbi:hypothetical protein HK104_008091, partial [Borealophlyctis nickersoniae]
DRLRTRDAEYRAMKGAYERKLDGLVAQLDEARGERDEALRRIHARGSSAGAGAVKARYEDQRRKLEGQIIELRRRVGDSCGKKGGEDMSKALQKTIETLKAEKARMLRQLKKESERNRAVVVANQREIAKLRRREKVACERVRKLEKSHQVQ